jgi:ubiquitin C-terminal hydrolase
MSPGQLLSLSWKLMFLTQTYGRLMGFPNLGASSFVNAGMQCLLHVANFYSFLQARHRDLRANNLSEMKKPGLLTCRAFQAALKGTDSASSFHGCDVLR